MRRALWYLQAAMGVLMLAFTILAWLSGDWSAMWFFVMVAAVNFYACWLNREWVS